MPRGTTTERPLEGLEPSCPQCREQCGVSSDLLPDEDALPPDELWAVTSIVTTLKIRRQERRTRARWLVLVVLLAVWVWSVHANFAVPHGTIRDAWMNYVTRCSNTLLELRTTVPELFSLWLVGRTCALLRAPGLFLQCYFKRLKNFSLGT